jgi:hypothetical protein
MSARRLATCHSLGSLATMLVCGVLKCGALLSGASLLSGVMGCASADPLVVGHHETDSLPDDALATPDDSIDPVDSFDGAETPDLVGDLTAEATCESQPFQACGGSLKGTWQVVDTCNGEDRSASTLAQWSQVVGLPSTMCNQAARVVTSNFSGDVLFSDAVTLDRRDLTMRFDMRLSSECLTATLQGPGPLNATQGACSALQNDYGVTCRSGQDVCQCSVQATIESNVIGAYDVRGSRLIATNTDQTVSEYDYCVRGDYLLYKQAGDSRYALLRRKAALDPVLSLPR